ncbi:MAG: diphthine synthase, partial [archaeon]
YFENYTSFLPEVKKEDYETFFNKKIENASREFVESGAILDISREKNVCLLIPGDVFIATTHMDLFLRAIKEKIKVKVIHNVSVLNAISDTGLQIYKFGRIVTIPFWFGDYKPTSFIKMIHENHLRSLHSLILLDLDIEKQKYLNPNEALGVISEASLKENLDFGCGIPDLKFIVCCRMGSQTQKIYYGKHEDLISLDFGKPPWCIILPGKLHPVEEEVLKLYEV